MSIETYKALNGKLELYRLLDEGRVDVSEPAEKDLRDIVRYIASQLSA